MENLAAHADTQSGDWIGTASGDDVDFTGMENLFGVDKNAWHIVVVEIHSYGGTTHLVAYALPTEASTYDAVEEAARTTGRLEVTRVVDRLIHPAGWVDTNPPRPPSGSIQSAAELIGFGFKRMMIRFVRLQPALRDAITEIEEVASVVVEDESEA